MARGQKPLLARPSSEESSNASIAEEEDALLTGKRVADPHARNSRRWREIVAYTWAFLATVAVVVLATYMQQQPKRTPNNDTSTKLPEKRNLIFMVSDGMGPTSLSLTRSFKQYIEGTPWNDTLTIDKHIIGSSRTRSDNSLVTDSAAGATAFSCGMKSYNGAISVLPDHSPCGSVMEAAKRAGYMTGLVVTTRITDATPACFAAHVNTRAEEDTIAAQMLGDYPLGHVVDLMLGGGRCHFLPNSTDASCRGDNKDMIRLAKDKGYEYIETRKQFNELRDQKHISLPLLGLFAGHDIPYEIDRRSQDDIYPSLKEMASVALRALKEATKDSSKGFFLMVEGSRIDHAGHGNDPAAQVHEVLAYDAAMQAILDFLAEDSTTGLMVSTSDHETGGLATARQLDPYAYPQYLWYPDVLAKASHSSEWMAQAYSDHIQSQGDVEEQSTRKFLKQLIEKNLGIKDLKDAELDPLVEKPGFAPWIFADIISRRSQTGWSTHGHSAVDVNIYASDASAAKALIGNHENTEVGNFLADYLDVDVDAITRELRKAGTLWQGELWMGAVPVEGERLDGQSHLDHYSTDTKHKRCAICGV